MTDVGVARRNASTTGASRPARRPRDGKAAPKVEAPPVEPTQSRRTGRIGVKLALTLILLVVLGSAAGLGTWSAFSSTTDNTGNTFQAGTVILSDNDSSTAMLALANAKPGDGDTSCITVTYSGTLASSVRLFGTTGGTGLDQYMDLVVTRGTGAAGFDNCTGFTADATNYIGSGAGVMYSGTLQAFADSYATALVDPVAASPEVWTTSEAHQYRFAVTVQDNNAAQGLNATQAFTWEARNN